MSTFDLKTWQDRQKFIYQVGLNHRIVLGNEFERKFREVVAVVTTADSGEPNTYDHIWSYGQFSDYPMWNARAVIRSVLESNSLRYFIVYQTSITEPTQNEVDWLRRIARIGWGLGLHMQDVVRLTYDNHLPMFSPNYEPNMESQSWNDTPLWKAINTKLTAVAE